MTERPFSDPARPSAPMIGRRSVQHSDIYSFESYTGVTGAITPRVGMTIGLTYNFDNLLGQAFMDIPGGRFFPGSPALRLFLTNKYQVQLTSGLQVSFYYFPRGYPTAPCCRGRFETAPG